VNTPFDSLVDELVEYARAGLSNADALRSATSESARILRQADLGQVRPRFAADLLLARGNPLKDLENLRKPLMVLQAGKIVVKGDFDENRIRIGNCGVGISAERGGDGKGQAADQTR